MIHTVRAYDTNGSNLNHFFAVHRETESQVPSDADLEHPDGKNAETGKFQVRFSLYLTPLYSPSAPPGWCWFIFIRLVCQRKADLTDADFWNSTRWWLRTNGVIRVVCVCVFLEWFILIIFSRMFDDIIGIWILKNLKDCLHFGLVAASRVTLDGNTSLGRQWQRLCLKVRC